MAVAMFTKNAAAINFSSIDKRDQPFVKKMREDNTFRPVYWRKRVKGRVQATVIANAEPGSDDYGTRERFLLEEGYQIVIGESK